MDTRAFVRVTKLDGVSMFEDEYFTETEDVKQRLEKQTEELQLTGTERMRDIANDEIDKEWKKAEKKLDEARKELEAADEELAAALADALRKLKDGEQELKDKKAEGEALLAEGKKKLEEAKKEIEKGREKILEGEKELEKAKEELRKAEELLDGLTVQQVLDMVNVYDYRMDFGIHVTEEQKQEIEEYLDGEGIQWVPALYETHLCRVEDRMEAVELLCADPEQIPGILQLKDPKKHDSKAEVRRNETGMKTG